MKWLPISIFLLFSRCGYSRLKSAKVSSSENYFIPVEIDNFLRREKKSGRENTSLI